jgi:type II secretory pathway component GspD/PulD (secretin)
MSRHPDRHCSTPVRRKAVPGLLCVTLCCSTFAHSQQSQALSDRRLHGDTAVAQSLYQSGAQALNRDDLETAQRLFTRAAALDPQRTEYAIALAVAREHKVTELIHQASRARQSGNAAQAETLLDQARALDPENPLVLQHTNAQFAVDARPSFPSGRLVGAETRIQPAASPLAFAGVIALKPHDGAASLHLSGDSQDVLRQIAEAYGIHAIFDDSVGHKQLRFDLEHQPYARAMEIAMSMAGVFAVPVDGNTVLLAKNSAEQRARLKPVVEETLYFQGMTQAQLNDLGNVIRGVFEPKQISVQNSGGTMVVRAPLDVIEPLNHTVQDLLDADSDILLNVQLYEIDLTNSRNIGVTLPTQVGLYNVYSAADNIVSQNASIVQQAIAEGYITAGTSNLQIALALIGLGLVQSSLAASTLGYFGNGLTLTGVTETGTVGFNLGLNTSDTRTLDDIQLHLADGQDGTFKSGTRYPITTSTYTSGISAAASSLSNAKINGVSVASLLSQYSGGSSVSIPQVTYEDLGVTIKATPGIQKNGRVNLKLDMKVEALAGGTLDGNPILASRQFTSAISVRDGETAMLASSLSRSETVAVSGLPGLSDLPGYQVPLDQNSQKNSGQLVVLITPHIIKRRTYTMATRPIRVDVPPEGDTSGANSIPFPAQTPEAQPPAPPAPPPTAPTQGTAPPPSGSPPAAPR